MSGSRYWTIDEAHVVHGPFAFEGWIEWAKNIENWETYERLCIVGRTQVDGDCRVATDFMRGIDLGLNWLDDNAPPLLFETMVFGGRMDGCDWRCSTWAQAEEEHRTVVALVMSSGLPYMVEPEDIDNGYKKSPGTRRPGDDAAGAGV